MLTRLKSRKARTGIVVGAFAVVAGLTVPMSSAQVSGDQIAMIDPLLAELMEEGEAFYSSNCAGCHGDEGEGVTGPGLVASDRLSSIGTTVRQILFGGDRMPAMGQFSDRQIAGVATFIRNSFDNDFGIVTEEEVASWR